MAAIFLLSFVPTRLEAGTRVRSVSVNENQTISSSTGTNTVLLRLSEIRAMDFSDLNRTERKSLRKELRSMKSELNAIGGGVYVSAGALILIVILLILLL